MPITRPFSSSSGPPELPGLIDASVWITSGIVKPFGASIWRWRPDTMPVVTVRTWPKGLPIAMTGWPTSSFDESPSGSGVRSATSDGVDLEHRDVGGGVDALDLGLHGVAVLVEAHRDAVRALDDVRVGHDVALVVDDEARSRRRALLRKAERRVLVARDPFCGDERHAATLLLVDVANAAALAAGRVGGRLRRGRLAHHGRGVTGVDHVRRDQDRADYQHDQAAQDSGDDV